DESWRAGRVTLRFPGFRGADPERGDRVVELCGDVTNAVDEDEVPWCSAAWPVHDRLRRVERELGHAVVAAVRQVQPIAVEFQVGDQIPAVVSVQSGCRNADDAECAGAGFPNGDQG